MKLIDLITSSRISDDEANRILNKMREDDEFYQSLKKHSKYAYDKIYKRLSNTAVKKKYNKKRMNRFIEDYLKDLKIVGRHDSRYLSAYRNLPIFIAKNGFIGNAYRDLYTFLVMGLVGENDSYRKLLETVEVEKVGVKECKDGNEYPTISLFRSILKEAGNFGLGTKDILYIYEVIHFERMTAEEENEVFHEELVGKQNRNSRESSSNTTKELISQVESKIDKVLKEQNVKLKDIKSDIKSLSYKERDLEKNSNTLLQVIDSLKDDIKKTVSLDDIGKIKQDVKSWEDKIRSLEHKMKKEISRLEKEFKSIISSEKSVAEERFLQSTIEHQKIIDSRIREIVEDEKRKFYEIDFRPVWLEKVEGKRENIGQEIVFLSAWKAYLSSKYEIYLTDEQLVVAHCILKTFSCSIFNEEKILQSWLELLDVEENTFIESANPLWTRRLDWIGLSTHLEDQSLPRRFGIMRDFDTAIVGAYLVPQLAKWNKSSIQERIHLYLVPAGNSLDKLDSTEVAHLAPEYDMSIAGSCSLEKNIPTNQFQFNKYIPRVQEKNLKSWIVRQPEILFREELIVVPSKSFQIDIPFELLDSFNSLYPNLDVYLTEQSAKSVALKLTIGGYLSKRYGEEVADSYVDFVMGYFV
ncbi:MAG: hypothetical protein BM556_05575 [Bacteriovorax sp. MedPE-SWde]|mgnify:CR=1 FL=1|nr:MAG: hypothetical protein BM556_05575 [Bacteriovorax sp. MedPE-SWde]